MRLPHVLESLLRIEEASLAAFTSLLNTDTATSSKPSVYGKCAFFRSEKLMHRVLTNARLEVVISSTKDSFSKLKPVPLKHSRFDFVANMGNDDTMILSKARGMINFFYLIFLLCLSMDTASPIFCPKCNKGSN